jgi:DnaJ-class molecular chaperone
MMKMKKPEKTEDGLLLVDCLNCNGKGSFDHEPCYSCGGDGGFLMTEEQYQNYISNYLEG